MQPELERPEISGLLFPCQVHPGFLEMLYIPMEPHNIHGPDSFAYNDHSMRPQWQKLLFCAKLELELKLGQNGIWTQGESGRVGVGAGTRARAGISIVIELGADADEGIEA